MDGPIPHHERDASGGLELGDDGKLSCYLKGDLVASIELSAEQRASLGLAEILAGYQAQMLFPKLRFSADGSERIVQIEVEMDFTLGHVLMGSAKARQGETDAHGLWQAARIGSNAFLLQDQLPDGARPWARYEERGRGWEIQLPAFLMIERDPVLRQRGALAIEELIYSLQLDREIDYPYERTISNVFSAAQPTWPQDLPLIQITN